MCQNLDRRCDAARRAPDAPFCRGPLVLPARIGGVSCAPLPFNSCLHLMIVALGALTGERPCAGAVWFRQRLVFIWRVPRNHRLRLQSGATDPRRPLPIGEGHIRLHANDADVTWVCWRRSSLRRILRTVTFSGG